MEVGGQVARFDRYMLRQLLLAFGFFGLVLVLVYWINRAVWLFDQLIANGETALVFAELSLLTLPLMISIVLPVAAFAASIFVTNRLSAENELVVAQSAGFGPFRMARPVFLFGLLTSLFMLVLAHVLVPMSQQRLAERQAEISQNISARFLTEGAFVHPAEGITLYIREITPEGELLDLFLSDQRNPAQHYTYSAERALLVRTGDGPRLVMFRGLAQILDTGDERLSIAAFDDFTFNLSALVGEDFLGERAFFHLPTRELLAASPAIRRETGQDRAFLRTEALTRSARALLALVAALTGFATLLLGSFSRFGLWRQILGAVLLLALVQFIDNSLTQMARMGRAPEWIVFAAPAAGLGLVALILWLSPRPVWLPWGRRATAAGAPPATPATPAGGGGAP